MTDAPGEQLDPERWLDEHGDVLFRFALARVRERAVAEDLVQETLLAALRARSRFAGRAAERTWLIAILKNKVIDHFRKHAREQSLDALEDPDELINAQFEADGHWHTPPDAWANPMAAFENEEFWRRMRECLDGLPERQAQAFSLCEFDGLEGPEACKVLGVSPSNLWVLLHRARMRLRQCLETGWFRSALEEKR